MTRKTATAAVSLLCTLVLLVPVMVMADAVTSETGVPYTVTIVESGQQPYAGEPFFIELRLDPQILPPGFFVSVLVDAEEHPAGAKPEILTGFPTIRLTMPQKGFYRVAIRVSLVSKSSCAGVDASGIFEEALSFQVAKR